MSEVNNIFILGAGASCTYGFPTGPRLTKLILHRAQELSTYVEAGFEEKLVKEFARAFSMSGEGTIDFFLSAKGNEYFSKIGKFAIAHEIARKENINFLTGVKNAFTQDYSFADESPAIDQGWYRYFWQNLDRDLDRFGHNSCNAVITFNYDRSFEQFMHTSFRNLYSKLDLPDEHVRSSLSAIPVVHVHGSLGKLPWQVRVAEDDFHDFGEANPILVKKASENIKIISEAGDNDHEIKMAWGLIQNNPRARVFFLGFGFHRDNLRRLRLDRHEAGRAGKPFLLSEQKIFATTMGLMMGRVESISMILGKKIYTSPASSCLELLQEYF